MKLPRSFSLLNFLLIATVAAIGSALYRANYEVHEKRTLFKKYSEEMGFMDIEDDTKLYVRQLGGYPQLSFAYRYQFPKKASSDYTLRVGSGVIDPESGFPPVLVSREISQDESQETLIVDLVKMPTYTGTRWTVQLVCDGRRSVTDCKEFEFAWLQTYLVAYPDDKVRGFLTNFSQHQPSSAEGHSQALVLDPTETHVLYEKSEFHPSAVPSLTPELLKNRKTFMIWLEPVPDD